MVLLLLPAEQQLQKVSQFPVELLERMPKCTNSMEYAL
jgi:hypothetical protein